MRAPLTRETFAQNLNTQFRIQGHAARPLALELIQASEARASRDHETFSIVFRGPPDAFLPQGMYPFQHDAIGTFELFIVPIRQDERGLYYEAVFNLWREEAHA